jgi:hypothetical protein
VKVDFDNLRRNCARDFNNLIHSLKGEANVFNPFCPDIWDQLHDSHKQALDNLRMNIGFILSCHDPENDEINIVDDIELLEVFTDEELEKM